MAVNLSPVGGVAAQFFTNTGAVLTGGKIYTYAAGTTTPATTYTSSNGATAWTNPIVLDAAGRVSGSGEIWLTDGINYKFVLKDSNDVLIATYDNISGINSNFVAFINQQEIITATASQTVFNLSIDYSPGTNSLSVFVDGVNQYGPGAQYSYVETDSNTVTFNSGLHVGAEVKFTTSQLQGGGAVDASQVSYIPPFTGSVATNVEAKLAQYVSVIDFGAVGDGVTDDTAAINAALDASTNVYLPPGTYLHTSDILVKTETTFYGAGWQSVLKHTTGNMTLGAVVVKGIVNTNVQNVIVRNMKIEGSSSASGAYDGTDKGIYIKYAEHITVDGVWVEKAGGEAVYAEASGGGETEYITFQNNYVSDSAFNAYNTNGLILYGMIINNFAYDIGNFGFEGSGSDLIISGNIFNKFDGSAGISVGGWNSDNAYQRRTIISNNKIMNGTNVSGSGIYMSDGALGVICESNYIYNCAGRGIYARYTGGLGHNNYSSKIIIQDNILEDNAGDAQILAESRDTLITDNLVFRTSVGQIGIWADNSDGNKTNIIEGNYVFGHTTDIRRDNVAYAYFGPNWVTSGYSPGDTQSETFVFDKSTYATNGSANTKIRARRNGYFANLSTYMGDTVTSGSFDANPFKNAAVVVGPKVTSSSGSNANGGSADSDAYLFNANDILSAGINNASTPVPGGPISITLTLNYYAPNSLV
jgi:hypothetical protein